MGQKPDLENRLPVASCFRSHCFDTFYILQWFTYKEIEDRIKTYLRWSKVYLVWKFNKENIIEETLWGLK